MANPVDWYDANSESVSLVTADGTVTITPAQLGYLLEGIDWRMPQRTVATASGRLIATL
jgi:hypothetical protein